MAVDPAPMDAAAAVFDFRMSVVVLAGTPEFRSCAVVAALAGVVRGFSGFGAALVLTPLLSLVLGTRDAVATTILLTGLTALQQVPAAWPEGDWRRVSLLAAAAIVAMPLGTWALLALDAETMRRAVAVVVIGFTCLLASGWRYRGPTPLPATLAVGAASGVLTGAAGIGGPPVVVWLLAGQTDARRARANFILFFGATLGVAPIALLSAGLVDWTTAGRALCLAPVFMAGTWVGGRLSGRASDRAFRWAALAILFAGGIAALAA
ncbi:MAG TPA: sulfite exporter TauE/SafE family protein [Azospirillaceae bacterium]|nr:sulfite exporter TauE/SafE family protein [Azospirillaceae bacterium]